MLISQIRTRRDRIKNSEQIRQLHNVNLASSANAFVDLDIHLNKFPFQESNADYKYLIDENDVVKNVYQI